MFATFPLPQRLAPALLAALGALVGSQALAEGPTTLAAHIEGVGSPTLGLVSGLGDTLDVWREVQPAMATNCARTFAYTRAGYDGSPPASGPRDAATIVAELRAELQRRQIPPPYVVAGHSLGGLYAQYFARQFPSEVSGLLLIDSTHWHQQLPSTLGAPSAQGSQGIFVYMPLIMRRELADSAQAGEEVHTSPPASNVPTIVLSRTMPVRGETQDSRLLESTLQREIATDFPAAAHVNVSNSGHYIQRDRPTVVVNAARRLVGCAPL
jgi:pimeloyl-ACP methyl ester carboxylesterase